MACIKILQAAENCGDWFVMMITIVSSILLLQNDPSWISCRTRIPTFRVTFWLF